MCTESGPALCVEEGSALCEKTGLPCALQKASLLCLQPHHGTASHHTFFLQCHDTSWLIDNGPPLHLANGISQVWALYAFDIAELVVGSKEYAHTRFSGITSS